MSLESECMCCIHLSNELKCALDEVSSMNLIMQLLWNDLTSHCARVSSVADASIDNQDHEESTHRNWIEVVVHQSISISKPQIVMLI
jgi:hypothetical protein